MISHSSTKSSDLCKMENDENSRKRKLAVVATAHVAVANAMAASYMLLNIPREPHVNRDDERTSYMNSILMNEDKCCANLRMGVDAFHDLCELIRQQNIMRDSQNCTLEEVVMRFLHLLGHNVRHRVIEGRFYRSRETVSRQFNETLNCVVKLYKCLVADHLQAVHEGGTPPEIASDPLFANYFQDCVGALDGTHINATVPIEEQDKFRGRKLITTQNVLAACSFDLKFTYALTGWEGTAHDQRVLDDARMRSNPLVVPQGRYYLVDAGYTHEPGFFGPYHGSIYHLKQHEGRTPRNEKELFNVRHAHLRSTIERAFGVLKQRWPILSTDSHYPYKTQVKIAMACFVLHNHIMGVDPNDSFVKAYDKEKGVTPIESIDDAPSTSSMSHSSDKKEWIRRRDEIAQKMYDDFEKKS